MRHRNFDLPKQKEKNMYYLYIVIKMDGVVRLCRPQIHRERSIMARVAPVWALKLRSVPGIILRVVTQRATSVSSAFQLFKSLSFVRQIIIYHINLYNTYVFVRWKVQFDKSINSVLTVCTACGWTNIHSIPRYRPTIR